MRRKRTHQHAVVLGFRLCALQKTSLLTLTIIRSSYTAGTSATAKTCEPDQLIENLLCCLLRRPGLKCYHVTAMPAITCRTRGSY